MTRDAYRRSTSGGDVINSITSFGSSSDEIEGAPRPPPGAASAASEMHYDLKEDEAVSMAQTERIVTRMRNRKT
jgi:hypothetical protein